MGICGQAAIGQYCGLFSCTSMIAAMRDLTDGDNKLVVHRMQIRVELPQTMSLFPMDIGHAIEDRNRIVDIALS